ncbi:MAG: 1-acyl-sn-glycerol-3-phosphate acyltransferase [Myxococcota bacterium]
MDWTGWLEEGRRYFGWRDIAHVLSPLAPVATPHDIVLRHHAHRQADDLDRRDPALIAWIGRGTAELARLFRLEVHGLENVPATGGALLVGSHNGGLMVTDSLFTVAAIAERFGPERRVYALAHDLVLYDRVAHRIGGQVGILRAGHESGSHALRAGHLVLVYPGSDMDSMRAWKDRFKVELAHRTGFIRLALHERVPIVPVLATGTHEQWIVLTRGETLAKRLGLGRLLRTKVFPIALALPFGLSFGLLPYLPLPAQTTIAFGPPLSWPDLPPAAADDPDVLARCYAEVTHAMQRVLDAMAKDRIPFIGQPAHARAGIDAAVSAAPAAAASTRGDERA